MCINTEALRAIHRPRVRGLATLAGAWLMAEDTATSASLYESNGSQRTGLITATVILGSCCNLQVVTVTA